MNVHWWCCTLRLEYKILIFWKIEGTMCAVGIAWFDTFDKSKWKQNFNEEKSCAKGFSKQVLAQALLSVFFLFFYHEITINLCQNAYKLRYCGKKKNNTSTLMSRFQCFIFQRQHLQYIHCQKSDNQSVPSAIPFYSEFNPKQKAGIKPENMDQIALLHWWSQPLQWTKQLSFRTLLFNIRCALLFSPDSRSLC